jgi:hypothetical protein
MIGMPARAATILQQQGINNTDLTERLASALFKSGLFEKVALNLYFQIYEFLKFILGWRDLREAWKQRQSS